MFTKSLIFVSLVFLVGNTTNFRFVENTVNSQEFEYIGAAKCKICHNSPAKGAQFKQWKESKHANAWNVLSEEEKGKPECAKCHSTAASVEASLRATITNEEGVSCESCHGPGSVYKSNSIMKDREKSIENGLIIPTEEICVKCHNSESPHFKGFDLATYMEKISHPKP